MLAPTMFPCYSANASLSCGAVQVNFSSLPMPLITFQTAWPGLPLMYPYEQHVPRLPCTAAEVAWLPRVMHHFYNPLYPREKKRLVLQRSVFDLINAHPYMALNDSKLLDWYCCLSAEDRDIIHDEGGFCQFLQSHPDLEVSVHHVYLKYGAASAVPVLQTLTSNQCTTPGSKTYRYELYKQVGYTKQPVCHQTSFQAVYQNPVAEKHGHVKAYTVLSQLSQLNEDSRSLQMVESRLPSLSEWPTAAKESPCKNRGMDQAEYTKWSTGDSPLLGPVEEHATEEWCQDKVLTSNKFAVVNDEDQSDFYSIMEDDKSILTCLPREDNLKVHPVTSDSSCDVMVSTDPRLSTSAFTQTERPETADKHVITEVHMADLDYLAGEFIKLKMNQDLREKMKRMNELPANIVDVLQKLDSDYNQMKQEILAGVPLEQLKPLSVDSENIIRRTSYVPAQVTRNENKLRKKERSKTSRAVALIPQDEEVNASEAWYDAKEDLELPETGQDQTSISTIPKDVSRNDETTRSALIVSNLPRNMTENEVMLLFEKYRVSEVRISALNDFRVAIVMVCGLQSAEAAVMELNGCWMQGHTLHLEHIGRDPGGSDRRDPTSVRGPEAELQTSKTRKLVCQPLLSSSIENKKVVCILPMAKGTCPSQRYVTMDSFETLMAELTELHPDVERQRIVDALVELRKASSAACHSGPSKT
ncbi:RNA-binding protein 44 isoform X2 [Mugil cephalus]|uniref:RNA-binding protein 44 isoform X2 n=1 Tax=Mugil cephalus TaxID=48193 RepID=UPI001FB60AD0|nr:RNA-binding protein 44 isoform X2 [Mugil cephalus]